MVLKNKEESGVVLIISIISAVVVVLLVVTLLLMSRGQEKTSVMRSLEKRAFFRADEAGFEAVGALLPHVRSANPPNYIDIDREGKAVVKEHEGDHNESITIEEGALNAPPAPPGYDLDNQFGRFNRFYIIDAQGEAKKGFLKGNVTDEVQIVIRAFI